MPKPIRKVLVANRGEIAVRVLRTCRDLGIAGVAVFSEPDRGAMHVRLAREAQPIGPAPASESYLNVPRIIDAARRSGADAIHPGYGFLSENADFAEACAAAGLTFIGPPPEAIRQMGDKTRARSLMNQAGVPMASGTSDDGNDPAETARAIGFPVLVKAAAGGGGRGMRVVHRPADLPSALETARREAESAFGDGRVFVEKYIEEARHVEFQILADAHGNAVHLFERECSIQRRHQKVIEEAPSPVLTPELRTRMGEAALAAARSCGYVNAGTVEFLVDENLDFHFMEMNTRLQVEHPVTEWITGIDLVAQQIRIAEGHPLPFGQSDLHIRGHAIECRVYAEDPENGFLPDPGLLVRHAPPTGPAVRVDAGVEEGDRVEIHYDPMIAKLTAWGRTRQEATRRTKRALDEYEVAGVRTTIPFCRYVMQHEAWTSGRFTTQFVERYFNGSGTTEEGRGNLPGIAALAAVLHRHGGSRPGIVPTDPERSRWVERGRWTNRSRRHSGFDSMRGRWSNCGPT